MKTLSKNKFNVWESRKENAGPNGPWKYVATVQADTEVIAVTMIECRYGKGTYKAYPHIDNETI